VDVLLVLGIPIEEEQQRIDLIVIAAMGKGKELGLTRFCGLVRYDRQMLRMASPSSRSPVPRPSARAALRKTVLGRISFIIGMALSKLRPDRVLCRAEFHH